MRIDDFGENADGENGLFVGEILLGGTLNSKWGKMGDHLVYVKSMFFVLILLLIKCG